MAECLDQAAGLAFTLVNMTSGRTPTASEVLDLLDRLQRDEARRGVLASSWEIYRAAVAEQIIGEDGIDWLAERMQELVDESLVAFGAASGGVIEPPRWNGGFIQMLHYWRVTAAGRADARLYRDELARPVASESAKGQAAKQKGTDGDQAPDLDLFISHASEDKAAVARPLFDALIQRGWSVWLDELELTIGDSLELCVR